jgi:hypothetical protein
MKPRPRIRKTIKWGGAAVTVLLVILWVGSRWVSVQWSDWRPGVSGTYGDGPVILVTQGLFKLSWGAYLWNPPAQQRWEFYRGSYWTIWYFRWTRDRVGTFLAFPLWIPSVMTAITTALAWRLDTFARRRARLNLCPKCNYDRAGIAGDAKCPECGALPMNR